MYDPFEWLDLSVDYYNIKVADTISQISAQDIINMDLDPASWGAIPAGLSITRRADGSIDEIVAGYANEGDLKARHLLAVHQLVGGDAAAGLEQLIEMLRRDRGFEDGLPKKALIDAFRIIEDEDLVGQYRRKMASLLF